MSVYAETGSSVYSAKPVELYRFVYGGNIYLYTSAAKEVVYLTDTYVPRYITHESFTQSGDANKADLSIQVHASDPITEVFRHGWLNDIMLVTVFRHYVGDTDFRVIWKGRIISCSWQGSTAKMISNSVFTMFKRSGVRRRYEIGCPLSLYSEDCGVDKDNFEFTSTVLDVNENIITVSGSDALGVSYFNGGVFKFNDNYRFIVKQDNDDIHILDTIPSLVISDQVSLWPGCGRSLDVCTNKFNNSINYGGLPYTPAKNIFAGNAIV